MSELIDEVLRLLTNIGVNASFVPSTDEDASPLIRTKDCSIVFTSESVRMHWEFDQEVGYDGHTAREILSEFTPNVDILFDGESQ